MRILLVCNAGMSSSILVKSMQAYASSIHYEMQIEAISSSSIGEEIGHWDACLVGPQISYAVEEFQEILQIPVAAIEMKTYAVADGKAAFYQARSLVEGKLC